MLERENESKEPALGKEQKQFLNFLLNVKLCLAVLLLVTIVMSAYKFTSSPTSNKDVSESQPVNVKTTSSTYLKIEKRLNQTDNVIAKKRSHESKRSKTKSSTPIPSWSKLYGQDSKTKLLNALKKLNPSENSKQYNGLIASSAHSLNSKLISFSLALNKSEDLPTLSAFNSTMILQVIDGYVLGVDLKFEQGFSGADWDMISEILCSGATHKGHQDLMMMMDELLSPKTEQDQQTRSLNGSWLIENDSVKSLVIKYKITIESHINNSSARFWLSSD